MHQNAGAIPNIGDCFYIYIYIFIIKKFIENKLEPNNKVQTTNKQNSCLLL